MESEDVVAFVEFLFVSFEDEAKAGAAFPRYGDDCDFRWRDFRREIRKNVKWASETYSFWQHRRREYDLELSVPPEARYIVFYNGTTLPGGYGSYEIRFELAAEEAAVQRFFPSGNNAFAVKIPPGTLGVNVFSDYRDPNYPRRAETFVWFEDEAKAEFPRYGNDRDFRWCDFEREIRKKWASDTYSVCERWREEKYDLELRVPPGARYVVFHNGTALPGGYKIRFELATEEAVQSVFPSGINTFTVKIPPGALRMKVFPR